MSAVLVAVITGSFGLLVVVLQHRLQRANSREHGVVRDTLVTHSEQIGELGGRVGDLRDDLRDVREDVRDVRDVVISLRDTLTFGVYEDHFSGRDWPAAAEGSVAPVDPEGVGAPLGGGNGHGAVHDGESGQEPDPFLTARRFPEGLF